MIPDDARVQLDLPHRVRFTRDAFAPGNTTLADVVTDPDPGRALIVVDRGLLNARPDLQACLLYTSPSPRDRTRSRMPSSA